MNRVTPEVAERSAMITGAFVFSEALEMILKEVLDKIPEESLKGKAKVYYKQYKSAMRTAKQSIAGFNFEMEQMMYTIESDMLKSDRFRKLANDMVRLYCHYRNSNVLSEENAKEFEQRAMEMKRVPIIPEEVISKFTLK